MSQNEPKSHNGFITIILHFIGIPNGNITMLHRDITEVSCWPYLAFYLHYLTKPNPAATAIFLQNVTSDCNNFPCRIIVKLLCAGYAIMQR